MSWAFTEYPWQVILLSRRGGLPDEGIRPDNGAGVWVDDVSEEILKSFSVGLIPTRFSDGSIWLEFPGPSFRVDGPQDLTLFLPGKETSTLLIYRDVSSRNYTDWSGKFHGLLTNHLQELAALLYEARVKTFDSFLERPLGEVIAGFLGQQDDDFASRALICDLATDLPGHIQNLVERPRRVLQRKHAHVRLDRLQEMDVRSLIDYARRPGRTAAVKAGDRQQLMAVVREETVNTLENRVVHDFCRRARTSALEYVSEECSRCRKCHGERLRDYDEKTNCSKRVRQVDAFARRCEQFLASPTLTEVTPLSEPCRMPNYALQQNMRYVKVWDAYQKLLRQEDIRDQTWRWKRRTWADYVRACMMDVMRTLTLDGNDPVFRASEKPIRIQKEPEFGCWLKTEPFDGPVVFEKDGAFISLYLFNREDVPRFFVRFNVCPDLLNADLYWMAVSTDWKEVRIMPVWAFVGDARWEESETLKRLRAECLEGIDEAGQVWFRQAKAAPGNEPVSLPRLLLIRAAPETHADHRGRVSLFETPLDKGQGGQDMFIQKQMASLLEEFLS